MSVSISGKLCREKSAGIELIILLNKKIRRESSSLIAVSMRLSSVLDENLWLIALFISEIWLSASFQYSENS